MQTRGFLEAVWPPTGKYVLATPWTPPGTTISLYRHRVFLSIDDAVAEVHRVKNAQNVFFAVHTVNEWTPEKPGVWNPNKTNRATGSQGAYELRTHANMHEARSFFWDLDIGEGDNKYPTREAALSDLQRFLFRTGLPTPLVTSSGGGFHVYWRVSTPIPSIEWKRTAGKLHGVAQALGMRNDPARTVDQSSVLRVVGTFNRKNPLNLRPVVIVHEGVETPNAKFIKRVSELSKEYGVTFTVRQPRVVDPDAIPDNTAKVYTGPVTQLLPLAHTCGHVRAYLRARGNVPEPLWQRSIAALQFVENGARVIEHFDRGHPQHDPAKTQEKLDRWNANAGMYAPPTCGNFDQNVGGGVCAACPHRGKGVNPLDVTNKRLLATPAPPPVVALVSTPILPHMQLVEPPEPFTRVKQGIMYTKMVDKKTVDYLISPYDMFPIADYKRTPLVPGYSVWCITIPREGQRIIEFSSSLLNDPKQLGIELGNHGIYIDHRYSNEIRTFMTAYIRKLQLEQIAAKQWDHLGWDADHTMFCTPRVTLHTDGRETPSSLSEIVKPTRTFIKEKGTLAGSLAALQFYNHDQYLAHQFAIMASLASPIFHATGLGGSVLSITGPTGGSKSTALYAGASLWGMPWDYVLSVTKNGSTVISRDELMITLANYPFLIDEITSIDPEVLRDSVFQWCQFGERRRSKPDGTPRPIRSEAKSLILVCTSNTPLQGLVSTTNAGGVASNMRIFEVNVPKATGSKADGDQFLRDIRENYGHIGPLFMRAVIPHLETVSGRIITMQKKFDLAHNITGGERHLSGLVASALTAGRLANQLGLLPYDWRKVRDWIVDKQLPLSRGVISEQESAISPLAIMASFLYSIHSDTLRVTPVTGTTANYADNDDKVRDIKAHYDTVDRVVYVRKDVFRDFCARQKRYSQHVLAELHSAGIVTDVDLKFTIGKGTSLAKARAVCFSVDLKHADLAELHETLIATPTDT